MAVSSTRVWSRSGWSSERSTAAVGRRAYKWLYDRILSRTYDVAVRWWALPFGGERTFRRTLLEPIAFVDGERILDLCCGTGGATTVRGYQEDVFHGTRAAWGSIEARIGRPNASRLYTFYDLGYFDFWTLDPVALDPTALIQIRGWPRGYGLGLLARTPAGDISLAIGFPGTVDFDQAKLHVTLLETF